MRHSSFNDASSPHFPLGRASEGPITVPLAAPPAVLDAPAPARFTIDLQGRLIDVNDAATHLSGYSRAELLDMSWVDLCAPEVRTDTLHAFLQQGGQQKSFASILITRSGRRRSVEITGGLAAGPGGTPVILASVRDVTGHRSDADLRQALQNQEHFLARLSEVNPSVIYVFDLALQRTAFLTSRQALAVIGYSPQELLTMGDRVLPDLLHPDDAPRILQHLARFPSLSDHEVVEIQYRLRHRDGAYRWFDAREAVFSRDFTGVPTQVIGCAVDITDRKNAEASSQETQAHLKAFLDSAAIGAAQVDTATGRFAVVNDRYCQITGYSREELLGLTFSDVTHPDDRLLDRDNYFNLVQEEVKFFQSEKRYLRKDGAILWVEVDVTAIRDATGRIYRTLGVVHDITARKNAEESIRRARDEAERASKAKDHFLAVLSHELRTPLTPVLAAAQMLGADASLPESHRDTLQMIARNVTLEARLIDDLLDLTRITRGKLQVRKEPVNLHEKIGDVVGMLSRDVDTKELQFFVELDAAHHTVEGDPARLQQIIWNLLSNAIKFTPVGGTVRVRTCDHAGRLQIRVADTGIGIDPRFLPHVFDAFEQGGESMTRRFGGLGLGLTITKALVDMHGGEIHVASAGLDCGAEFLLEFPLLVAADLLRAAPPHPGPPLQFPRRLRILLVEDHADTRRMMARLLTMGHADVTAAGTVAEALAAVAAASPPSPPFDLLVCDIGLPDGTGHDVARAVKRTAPDTWCLALSGFGMEEDIRRSIQAGFDEHLTKPVDLKLLQDTISRLVRAPSARPAVECTL
jgi:PAS domain S-box-containing protein